MIEVLIIIGFIICCGLSAWYLISLFEGLILTVVGQGFMDVEFPYWFHTMGVLSTALTIIGVVKI